MTIILAIAVGILGAALLRFGRKGDFQRFAANAMQRWGKVAFAAVLLLFVFDVAFRVSGVSPAYQRLGDKLSEVGIGILFLWILIGLVGGLWIARIWALYLREDIGRGPFVDAPLSGNRFFSQEKWWIAGLALLMVIASIAPSIPRWLGKMTRFEAGVVRLEFRASEDARRQVRTSRDYTQFQSQVPLWNVLKKLVVMDEAEISALIAAYPQNDWKAWREMTDADNAFAAFIDANLADLTACFARLKEDEVPHRLIEEHYRSLGWRLFLLARSAEEEVATAPKKKVISMLDYRT